MSRCIQALLYIILKMFIIQDDETFKIEGGFLPERDQYYFELKQDDRIFLLGFKDILTCVKLLEEMEEIPRIDTKWWQQMASLYGDEILSIEYKENVYESN